MFVTFEKAGHKYLVPVVEAHEGDGVLTIATPPDDCGSPRSAACARATAQRSARSRCARWLPSTDHGGCRRPGKSRDLR